MKQMKMDTFSKVCFGMAAAILILIAILLLTSCTTTKIVEVEKVRTDTTYITKQQRDSIWLHDSLYIHEYTKGDTVYLERTKWMTKFVERLRVDTLWRSKTDTVIIQKTIEKTNEARSWWQRLRMNIGTIAIIILISLAFCAWVCGQSKPLRHFLR